ncbi:hypothetical protein [Mesorhizobium sp. GbtcB19]|uniref:hypothetical protein n=1 Tax=Mesorhizobium sp. GbtcB19 TaxID=2824764 RepID=UPI001C2F86BE|nr:hypothetical protein [Mesorhizobium sp. GbtcB19]
MEKEQSLEYRFVLSPADFAALHSKLHDENRLDALRRLSLCVLVGLPLTIATNFVDATGALAGVLGVVGMMTIVAGITTNLSSILAKKGNITSFEPETNLIRVHTAGISKCVADSEIRLGWGSVDKITLTEFGIGFVTKEGGWFIPISAFGSEAAMKAEYEKIVSVMASGHPGYETSHEAPHTLQ